MIQTGNGDYLYFNPEISKKNNLQELLITQHSKYIKKTKIKITKSYFKTKVQFDSTGRIISTIYLYDKGADTNHIPDKFVVPVVDNSAIKSVVEYKNEKYYVIENFNGQERIKLDHFGNVIYCKQITHHVESYSHVDIRTYSYDSLNRLTNATHTFSYISWSKENTYDTIPLNKDRQIYYYENNFLRKRDNFYEWKDQKEFKSTTFYYYKNEILESVEDGTELTKEIPEKNILLVKDIRFYTPR